MYFQTILQQIGEDKLEQAFQTLKTFYQGIGDQKAQFLALQSRHANIQREKVSGTIPNDELDVKMQHFTRDLIGYVAILEGELEESLIGQDDFLTKKTTRSIRQIVQDIIHAKGYIIIDRIKHCKSSTLFKVQKMDEPRKGKVYLVKVYNYHHITDIEEQLDESIADFFFEAHPPFMRIHELSQSRPRYIIRDFIDGINLNDLIKKGVELSIIQVLEIATSLAKGLADLHRSRIIHNDFTPERIFLDIKDKVHIGTINIFKNNQDSLTWQQLMDNLRYMSPEQVANFTQCNVEEANPIDSSCNQYSLGLIMFYMLMSEPLYDGAELLALYADRFDARETTWQLRNFEARIKRKLLRLQIDKTNAKNIAEKFSTLIQKMLNANPENRYSDMDSITERLEFLKASINIEKSRHESREVNICQKSYERTIYKHEDFLSIFYRSASSRINRLSIKDNKDKEIILHCILRYCLDSISKPSDDKEILELASKLFQIQHPDLTMEEFEIFLEVWLTEIQGHDPDCTEEVKQAWQYVVKERLIGAIHRVFLEPQPN